MRKMCKKGISIILVMLMVMGGILGLITPEGKVYAAEGFAGGGVPGNPYQITTADQLNEVRNHLSSSFQLTADINLSSYGNWEPIGSASTPFQGNMDGNGYKITNLTMDRFNNLGLFGDTGQNSVISNIILENITIKGQSGLGGLVGSNRGTISNSYAKGSVNGYASVGGLVGINYAAGTISNSYSTVKVIGSNAVGSLSGQNQGTISNSYATGEVSNGEYVGGLVGYQDMGTIENSYATGNVSGTSSLGGLLGKDALGAEKIYNSYYDSVTTGQPLVDTGRGIGKSAGDMKDKATFSGWNFNSDWYMLSGQYPQLWAFTALTQGTNSETTKLNNVAVGMEYSINGSVSYTAITGTSVDNITVKEGDTISVRVVADILSAKTLTVVKANIKPLTVIATAAITGVTVPVTGATPVAMLDATTAYTAAISWSPVGAKFAGDTAYTATITITPTAGHTLTGVIEDFFTIAGATTTNDADSGIVTAEFPATEASPIVTADITGVTAPVTGAIPVSSIEDTSEYTAVIEWSPADAIFNENIAYTAMITIIPTAGHTLTGVGEDFFKVAGATTANDANSGIVTAEFPATEASPITTAIIDGVTAPVIGATPVSSIEDTSEYTAVIEWSPADATFKENIAYTAMITITPTAGHTLTGVGENFFKVAGATTTTNTANDGVVTAVFAVNNPIADATLTSTIGIVSMGGTVSETITDIPFGTTLAELKSAITLSSASVTYEVYGEDGITVAVTLATGYKVIVTDQDGITIVTYTLTVKEEVVTPTPTPTPTPGGGSSGGGGGGSTTPTSPIDSKVTSTDGKLELPVGRTGQVSLGDAITISIPAGATNQAMKLTIEEVLNTQVLLTKKEILASSVFEILKNFTENFSKPVTLTFTFDPTIVQSNQIASVFYYDEAKKAWVKVEGSKTNGNLITVEVNHFTKYAVLVVDQSTGLPVIENPTGNTTEVNFSDIAGHWAEVSIKQAISNGIVAGYTDGTFKPNATVTRAEFVVMLMNALKPQEAGATLTFTDSAKIGAWAQKAIAQAVQAGIIKGNADGTFRPDAEVTRAEMAVMIANAVDQTIEVNVATGFEDDKDIPAWALGSVAFVKQAGIVHGKNNNKFVPQDHATRAEAVTVLLNMLAQERK